MNELPKFIRVTEENADNPILINTNHVKIIAKNGNGSEITMNDDEGGFFVEEPIEHFEEILNVN